MTGRPLETVADRSFLFRGRRVSWKRDRLAVSTDGESPGINDRETTGNPGEPSSRDTECLPVSMTGRPLETTWPDWALRSTWRSRLPVSMTGRPLETPVFLHL
jgi:hypothetical protein